MLKVLGKEYFLDLDKIESYINIPNPSGGNENHISVVKYDMVKMMVEILLTESEQVDEQLGEKSSELSIPFKIAFNSLMNKHILTKF
jgi:hypothetical protein